MIVIYINGFEKNVKKNREWNKKIMESGDGVPEIQA
jgi:hypothetical protein